MGVRTLFSTLRSRITVAAAIVLAAAAAIVGIATSNLARNELLAPINSRLEQIATGFPQMVGRTPPTGQPSASGNIGSGTSGSGTGGTPVGPIGPRPEGREAALLRFVDGERIVAFASGFADEERPLPGFSPQDSVPFARSLNINEWTLKDLTSEDGSIAYRAVVIHTSEPVSDALRGSPNASDSPSIGSSAEPVSVISVFAIPLDDVDATVARIRIIALVVSITALGIAALMIWAVVRRSLRPVSEIAQRSAQIGPDTLDQRMPMPNGTAEVDLLASSINSMLDDLEKSHKAELAARVALNQFVADASHELRTPIAAIAGHAELLANPGIDAETQRRSLGRIESESTRMRRLVDDLLTLAAHDTGHRRLQRRVNLTDIATDAIEDARAIDPQRSYDLVSPGPVHVDGDELQLAQIITNLLANVRSHTPIATEATIDLHVDDNQAVLTVRDTGPGIDPELQRGLFERFSRRPDARSGGAGLGLAIVSALVAEHDGTVRLVGSYPGSTSFEVRLPAHRSLD